MDIFNHKVDTVEKTISKMKNRAEDNIQTEAWRPKRKKKEIEENYSKRHIGQVEKDQHICK